MHQYGPIVMHGDKEILYGKDVREKSDKSRESDECETIWQMRFPMLFSLDRYTP